MSAQDGPRADQPKRLPWYAAGVRFACQPECGKCCTRHGQYDYVYLERDDVRRLAAFLEMPIRAFKAQWTKQDEGHTILVMDGPACPFLDGARCKVYEARPRQCGSFPFWPETMKNRESWDELGTFCPGIGQGDFVPLEKIRGLLRGHES